MQAEPTGVLVAIDDRSAALIERAGHLALESLAGAVALALDAGLTVGQLHAVVYRAATDFASGDFDPRWDVPSLESLAGRQG